ncbi:exopolygalacturonase-like [Macadamia integrifolia]|uniref:exopolygalacturonase-like n=1 Tax=Macadamia integrifolia TaxID=60698 RepID=UPI001C4EA913|nr:exopolygalacturonase-like [Macadamia integrifolia]
MMGSRSRDVVLTCLLIGLLLWRVDARAPGGPKDHKKKPHQSKAKGQEAAEAPTGGSTSSTAPVASPAMPGNAAPAGAPTGGSASSTAPVASPATPGAAAPAGAPTGDTEAPQGTLFDVTKHGAVGDGKTDNNKAFSDAWVAACKSSSTGPSTFLIPRGDFLLSTIVFAGPCTNKTLSPSVIIRGNLIASTTDSNSKSWITFQSLSNLHISGAGTGSFNGKGETAWSGGCRHTANSHCNVAPANLNVQSVLSGSLNDITSVNSQGFHILVGNTQDFNIHDVKINAPKFSPNTDGIHVGNSTGITIANAEIGTGDDCVSIGSGTSKISVTNVKCGPGHGISLGSLGKYPDEKAVSSLLVKNCTLTSTDNGVRIKTWPGSPDNIVNDVRFEDITMTNVSNPIIINQNYCDKKACDSTPSHVKLSGIHFKNIKGTSFTKTAVALGCSSGAPCEQVELVDIDLKPATDAGAVDATCANVKGVITSGVLNPKPSCV